MMISVWGGSLAWSGVDSIRFDGDYIISVWSGELKIERMTFPMDERWIRKFPIEHYNFSAL